MFDELTYFCLSLDENFEREPTVYQGILIGKCYLKFHSECEICVSQDDEYVVTPCNLTQTSTDASN